MAEFFHMGGYAFYVWSSFGITFFVLLLNLILPKFHQKSAWREAENYYLAKHLEADKKQNKKHNKQIINTRMREA